ncbi:MAG TPA: transglycosylase SLT domain-containing protein [Candidatus Binataceae bacterium]|nr:transglycosylase SLT domain-containing protein [Candidatus Binataceae bacterium]
MIAAGRPPIENIAGHPQVAATATAGLELAQRLPFERNKIVPIDPRQSFVEGYQAFKRRDFLETIGRMQFVSSAMPALADYALFYLASAEHANGNLQGAADDFRRLTVSYPQSVYADPAGVEYARLELTLGHPDYALAAATTVADDTGDTALEQSARLLMAQALNSMGSWRAAYNQAQIVRQKFPNGAADAQARQLAYAILRTHPSASDAPPLEYHRTEAALLLREGQSAAALTQIRNALALEPSLPIRAELAWLSAEAQRANPDVEKAELRRYLELAPRGPQAGRALNRLAHVCWHEDDTAQARLYFARLVQQFPHDELAPAAIFESGRTYEDDGDLEAARTEFLKLIARYPGSESAQDAGFRAPFMLYMLKRYQAAAAEMGDARVRSRAASQRDMFAYWEARALEHSGQNAEAQQVLHTLALSTDSNYYPALAEMRLSAAPAVLAAATAPDLVAGPTPVVAGLVEFHLTRVAALRDLGLRELEAPELRAIEPHIDGNAELRTFVLAELQNCGAWYDAIEMATGMAAAGEVSAATAERIRYPRAFWDLVNSAAARNQLDPYLMTALIRQESWFNPAARSPADARGLMQLMPRTADRYAVSAGLGGASLDLYDPNVSVQIGAVYLRGLMGMFGDDKFKAVAAYNAGEQAVERWNASHPGDDDQWVENIGYRETRDYVKHVIGGMREYRLLYRSPSAASASTAAARSPG